MVYGRAQDMYCFLACQKLTDVLSDSLFKDTYRHFDTARLISMGGPYLRCVYLPTLQAFLWDRL